MIDQSNHIHIVGIKGVMMANLAIFLKEMGKNVTGSDVAEEFITDELLKKNKIEWQIGFKPERLPKNTDLIVFSAAHGGTNNPQIIEAKKRKVNILSQAELIGMIMRKFKTKIAVAGCHGKTTTSSLLAYALTKLNSKPSYLVGTPSFNNFPGGDFNGPDYFVIEADEYGVNPPIDKTPKFSFLNPDYILATNIDFDHPDQYKNLEEVKYAFLKFFDNKKLILCVDDDSLLQFIKIMKWNKCVTYGFNKSASLIIKNNRTTNKGSVFELVLSKKQLGYFEIFLFGKKNISNAAGVVLTLLQLGFPLDKIKKAIKGFTGAKRRFKMVYSKRNIKLFDDYAHHPKEIETTILAARERFPKNKIIVVFQPHTYSRTQALLKEFAKSLSLADYSYVLPIFPSARENAKNFHVTSLDIEKKGSKNNIKAVSSKGELFKLITTNPSTSFRTSIQPTVIFTMGAGDVYKLKNDIIEAISNVKSQSSKPIRKTSR